MGKHAIQKAIGLTGLSLVLVLWPFFVESLYFQHILIMMGLATVLAVSNRLILSAGVWFLGHAAFYAIGAYTSYLFRVHLSLNFWLAFPLAGLTAGIIALGLGYATSRVKGIYFCIITVAFVEVVRLTIINVPFLGGHHALKNFPPDAILGINFSLKVHYYYFILILVGLTLIIFQLIEKSPVRLILNTMAENEDLAESYGINAIKFKVITMSLCCFFAGLAGAFMAPYVTVIGPTSFTLTASIIILTYVMVGGIGSILGPVVGAVFLTVLPEILPGKASYQSILYALIILMTLFFLPGGLISLPKTILKNAYNTSKSEIVESDENTSSQRLDKAV